MGFALDGPGTDANCFEVVVGADPELFKDRDHDLERVEDIDLSLERNGAHDGGGASCGSVMGESVQPGGVTEFFTDDSQGSKVCTEVARMWGPTTQLPAGDC